MDSFLDIFLGNPLGIAIFGAHYLYFAFPAWAVLLVRAFGRRMSRSELFVFAVFSSFIVLEAVQLAVDGAFFTRQLWGLPRYFGVFASFLWLWLAKGVSDLWFINTRRGVRLAARVALVLVAGYVLVAENIRPVAEALVRGNGREALVAAENIAPVIRADYCGPRRQKDVRRTMAEYFQPRRPVVFGNFAAAAWTVRGQSEGAEQTITRRGLRGRSRCPYPPDYLFLCLGRVGAEDFSVDLDENEYTFVKGVQGIETAWGLFRRKGTPHR